MSGSRKQFEGITTKLGLEPRESPLMVANKPAKLYIGMPKEWSFQEHRIGLTPEAVPDAGGQWSSDRS
jgi:hypothetical protein